MRIHSLNLNTKTTDQMIAHLKQGLSTDTFDQLRQRLNISDNWQVWCHCGEIFIILRHTRCRDVFTTRCGVEAANNESITFGRTKKKTNITKFVKIHNHIGCFFIKNIIDRSL
jgi:hypothetical protein